jgi:hypothetical protein
MVDGVQKVKENLIQTQEIVAKSDITAAELFKLLQVRSFEESDPETRI